MQYKIGRLNGRFVVSWWVDGKRRRYRLEARTRAEAEAQAIDVIRRETAARATDGVPDIAALWEAYLREREGRPVVATMRYEWKALGPHFGHLRADQIVPEHSRAYIDKRRAQSMKDGTIWTELGHLRTVLLWGRDVGLISRAPRIERPPKPAPKDRYLTHSEIERLLSIDCAPHIKLAVQLMLATAARSGAMLELTWDRVDFERGQIDLRVDVGGPRKGRAVVPINDGLRAALTTARKAALTNYVIEWAGKPVSSIKKGFGTAARKAGLEDVTPHVLRHTAGVHLAAGGVPMSKISQYLGHSSTYVTERVYARFAPDHMREEAAILDFTKLRQVQ